MASDTIIAPASALGGGVAMIRVSGPQSGPVFHKLTGGELPTPRVAQLVELKDPKSGKILDKALALYFQNPASFTGEDVLELHVHGGRAVVHSVLNAVLALDQNIRLAEGGEFTKRAYLNGKIDLTEAEAIADLVAAETEVQADLARAQMGGSLRDLYEGWRHELTRILAHLEATIDFVDEEDVPQNLFADTAAKIEPLAAKFEAHLADGHLGERLREGFVVAVIGAPNAGKSSLVNALVKRDVAIVSDVAGTTRDTIEAHLNIAGFPVILIDTAGLRETNDAIESEGVRRARKKVAEADIILALFDATQPPDHATFSAVNAHTITVHTKCDLAIKKENFPGILVSSETGENINLLVEQIASKLQQLMARPKEAPPLLTRARHRETVENALQHLIRAIEAKDIALLTEDVRLSLRELGRLTGRVDVEDLLDVIFRDFCVGK